MKISSSDVYKDTIFCAIYDGKSYFVVKEFSITIDLIRELNSYLEKEKVEKVTM